MLSISCATECVLLWRCVHYSSSFRSHPVHVGVSAETNTLGTLFVIIWRVKFLSFTAVRISLCSSSWSHVFSNAWNNNEGAGSFPWSAVGLLRSLCSDRGKYSWCFSPLHQLGSAAPPPAQPALVTGCVFLPSHPMTLQLLLPRHGTFPEGRVGDPGMKRHASGSGCLTLSTFTCLCSSHWPMPCLQEAVPCLRSFTHPQLIPGTAESCSARRAHMLLLHLCPRVQGWGAAGCWRRKCL